MVEVSDKLEQLMVIKRNGKKVPFDETKIALAIKKGFDSVEVDVDEDEKARKYTTKDVQKVYQAVLKRLTKEAKNTDKFNAENVRGFVRSFKKETKIAIRNIRRDYMDIIKEDDTYTEDTRKKEEEQVQKITDASIKNVDSIIKVKSDEILSI